MQIAILGHIKGVSIQKIFDPCFEVLKLIDLWFNFDFWVSGTHLLRPCWRSSWQDFFSQVQKSNIHKLFNLFSIISATTVAGVNTAAADEGEGISAQGDVPCKMMYTSTQVTTRRFCTYSVLVWLLTTMTMNLCFYLIKSRGPFLRRYWTCILELLTMWMKLCGELTCITLLLSLVQVTGLGSRRWSCLRETQSVI